MSTTRFHSLQVREVQPATRDAIAVTFDLPPALAHAFQYTQGQYLTLRALVDGEEVRRSYSICSAVQDRQPAYSHQTCGRWRVFQLGS